MRSSAHALVLPLYQHSEATYFIQTFMIAPKTIGVTSTFCVAHVVAISPLRS